MYPNPAKEYITIDMEGLDHVVGDNITADILDSQGKLVSQISIADFTKREINVSRLGNGIYIMRIHQGGNMWTGTFVIEK